MASLVFFLVLGMGSIVAMRLSVNQRRVLQAEMEARAAMEQALDAEMRARQLREEAERLEAETRKAKAEPQRSK
jgi:hypothetical protein